MLHSETNISLVMAGAAKVNLDGIIETFATWDYPKNIRKLLFCVYSTLTNYVLSDSNACGPNDELANAMYLLKTLIENCDEMDDMSNRHLDVAEV